MIKTIFNIAVLLLINYLFEQLNQGQGLNIAIAPLVAMGVGAGIKGLMGLLSSNPIEEQKKRMLEELIAEEQQLKDENARNKKVVQLTAETSKKQRRGIASQNNEAAGIDDPTAIFSNEEDIINAQTQGLTDLDAQLMNGLNDIRRRKQQVEGMDTGPNALERGFGGAIEGANLGFDVAGALGSLTPKTTDPLKGIPTIPGNIGAGMMNNPVSTNPVMTNPLEPVNPIQTNPVTSPELIDPTITPDNLGTENNNGLSSLNNNQSPNNLLSLGDMNLKSKLPKLNYKKSLLRLG